jgi:CheY-like chemotaxis protein
MPAPFQASVILLAEDLESDIVLLRRAFTKAKIANPLKVVRDGEEVLAYLKGEGPYANREEHPFPALLLLDLKLPRMNGFEVLQWVRAHPDFKALRIVVLTASRDLEDVNRAYQFGANTFLIKPTDFDELVVMMQKLQGFWLWATEATEIHSSALRAFDLSRSTPSPPAQS